MGLQNYAIRWWIDPLGSSGDDSGYVAAETFIEPQLLTVRICIAEEFFLDEQWMTGSLDVLIPHELFHALMRDAFLGYVEDMINLSDDSVKGLFHKYVEEGHEKMTRIMERVFALVEVD